MVNRPQVLANALVRSWHAAVIIDIVVVILTLSLFWPLTRFFFAQDDFILLEKARHGLDASLGYFFQSDSGHFRPLTKGLYFVLAHTAFGLDAAPYHVVSILLHALCAVLLGVGLRRAGVAVAPARVAAAVFAFSMTNMEAVAWIACVQQLMGGVFALAVIILGIDAIEGRRRLARPAALLAFVLALASYEQTLAVPLVLLLWVVMRRGWRGAARVTREWGWMPVALLAVYLAFMLLWKGLPESGPYTMGVGVNVAENLRAYTAMVYSPWFVIPSCGVPTGFTQSHVAGILLVVFLLARRRWREVAFGLSAFLLLLAPVLFTTMHVYSFHLYVPALGAWFLVAVAVEELMALLPAGAARLRYAGLIALVATCFVGSSIAMDRNLASTSRDLPYPHSIVLRRAIMAERMWYGIRWRANPRNDSGRLILVYHQPQHRHEANWNNIRSALGQGSAVRLAQGAPDLDVIFVPPSKLPPNVNLETEVLLYTVLGEVWTAEEAGLSPPR